MAKRKKPSLQRSSRSDDPDVAEALCREKLETQPDDVRILGMLGNILIQKGNSEEAISCFKKIILIDPDDFGAWYNLGNIHKNQGEPEEALGYYRKAIDLNPSFVGSYNNIANIYKQLGRTDEAVYAYQKAIEADPDFAGACFNLAQLYQEKRELERAIFYYREAIRINPQLVNAYYNLGNALNHQGQFGEAIGCYQEALRVNPRLDYVYFNLGNTLLHTGQSDQAVACFRKTLEINPQNVYALANLANAFSGQGKIREAEEYYRQALAIQPGFSTAYSGLLLISHYRPYDAVFVAREHREFGERFEKPLRAAVLSHTNTKLAGRRLKIGYVSPDFRQHSVGYFIEPVLASHNHRDFEIFCYHNSPADDATTERLRGYSGHWRNIDGLTDAQAAETIRNDALDICVDLAGHTAYNRIMVFARKPAPVQVTWIGYPDTTGLSGMDYRIVDRYTDPPGMTENLCTEELLRMPESFLCYLPPHECPEVGSLPALKNGYVTLGSFNVIQKISPELIQWWAAILKIAPQVRLLVKAKGIADKTTRETLLNKFAEQGIHEERIDLLSWAATREEHLATYNRVDIVLDTFPYTGTTNTFEALWMGVPVITLEGSTHVSRVGVSILSNAGLPELIAKTPGEYIAKTVALAGDLARLQALRSNLRTMMQQSPLTDAGRFTAHLERIYREIWEKWCASP